MANRETAVAWMTRNTSMQAIRDFPGSVGARIPREVLYGDDPERSGHHPYSSSSLRKLYFHIKQTIVSDLGVNPNDWKSLGVEFHLTSPDTIYKRINSIAKWSSEFKILLRRAGIGTGGPRHCAVIGATEMQAAATAVFHVLPAARSLPRNLMIKIGATHVTVLLVERSHGEAPNSFTSRVVDVPELSCHIEDTVSHWLEESHPDLCQALGEGGLGRVVQEGEYRDVAMVLCGHPPQHESFSLGFQGLPSTFRHRTFEIRNGSIDLNRSVPPGEFGFPSAGLLLTLRAENI